MPNCGLVLRKFMSKICCVLTIKRLAALSAVPSRQCKENYCPKYNESRKRGNII